MEGKIVTFDFDGTLSRPDVQEYAEYLMRKGVNVWVLTSRYDELHKHRYHKNPTNEDLYKVVDKLGISRCKIRFTCLEAKANYLFGTDVIWHLDDDPVELDEISNLFNGKKGINVEEQDYREQCEELLK